MPQSGYQTRAAGAKTYEPKTVKQNGPASALGKELTLWLSEVKGD